MSRQLISESGSDVVLAFLQLHARVDESYPSFPALSTPLTLFQHANVTLIHFCFSGNNTFKEAPAPTDSLCSPVFIHNLGLLGHTWCMHPARHTSLDILGLIQTLCHVYSQSVGKSIRARGASIICVHH